jgi:hypothetical protein
LGIPGQKSIWVRRITPCAPPPANLSVRQTEDYRPASLLHCGEKGIGSKTHIESGLFQRLNQLDRKNSSCKPAVRAENHLKDPSSRG